MPVSAEQLLKICTCIASGAVSMSPMGMARPLRCCSGFIVAGQRSGVARNCTGGFPAGRVGAGGGVAPSKSS